MSGNDERAMLLFAQLASVAARKQQPIGRDRFLVLTGVAATRAGWPNVAACCHDLITAHSPQHVVGHYSSFADALRDDEFLPFLRQVERFCSTERAEHLLHKMELSPPMASETRTVGDICRALLEPMCSDGDA